MVARKLRVAGTGDALSNVTGVVSSRRRVVQENDKSWCAGQLKYGPYVEGVDDTLDAACFTRAGGEPLQSGELLREVRIGSHLGIERCATRALPP